MIENFRRSWPVLIGTLLFLFSTQEATAVLQESPDLLPGPAEALNLEQAYSPDEHQADMPVAPLPTLAISPIDQPAGAPDDEDTRPAAGPGAAVAVLPAEPAPEQASPASADAPIPPAPPTRLVIPAIDLDAPVVASESKTISVAGQAYQQWKAPDRFAAGWHAASAELGLPGNTVLNGHHNIKGEVFKRLEELSVGDQILVYSFEGIYGYEIANKMILPEKYEELDTRMNNAQWILPSQDERLTLVTCWPYESNTHRLIIVARPVHREKIIRNVQ